MSGATGKVRKYKGWAAKVLAVGILIGLASCKPEAQKIIDKTIAAHGGEVLNNVLISFDFRDKHYLIRKEDGQFQYERIFQDSLGKVRDILTNAGFTRLINDEPVEVSEAFQRKYANSVNAVVYLFLLPYGLNDKAVNKTYLGETSINGIPYDEIMVTFDEQGGGEDHEDTYLYWINKQQHTMDFFAYSFHTDGGGTRFREATNQRKIEGVLFSDYVNYTYAGDSVALDTYENLFQEDNLEEVSKIIMKNIEIKRL